MDPNNALLTYLIVGVCLCGAYLQYRGFKVMALVPTIADRKDRPLDRKEILTLAASAAYVLLGAWFEGLGVIHAITS